MSAQRVWSSRLGRVRPQPPDLGLRPRLRDRFPNTVWGWRPMGRRWAREGRRGGRGFCTWFDLGSPPPSYSNVSVAPARCGPQPPGRGALGEWHLPNPGTNHPKTIETHTPRAWPV